MTRVPTSYPVLLVLLAACGGRGTTPDRAVVSDSAGVRIVMHAVAPLRDTLDARPILTIGREGDPDYEFFRARTVVALGSGNIVVANGGSAELRFYDATGSHLHTVGGQGEGPGEIGFMSTLWLRSGDTLAVLDTRQRRVSYFDSAGVYVRAESYAEILAVPPPEDATGPCLFPGVMGLMDDGARVDRGWSCMRFEQSDGVRPTPGRLTLDRPGTSAALGAYSLGSVWERGGEEGSEAWASVPFSAFPSVRVGPDRIYVAGGAAFEVDVFDVSGALVAKMREDGSPAPVTDADRDAYVQEQRAAGRTHPADVPFPEHFPGYTRLVLSYEGRLWARRFVRPTDEARRWTVFSEDGESIRRIALPDVELTAVRAGRAYAIHTDDLGIESVVVYALER